MRAPNFRTLTMRGEFVPMPDRSLVEQLEIVPLAATAMKRSPCDRAGHVQLLREANATLLRKERVALGVSAPVIPSWPRARTPPLWQITHGGTQKLLLNP